MLPYFHIFGLSIPAYGSCMALGFLLCGFWAWKRAVKRGLLGENLIIIAACIFGLSMTGGILLYDFVTYSPAQIWEYICEGKWDYIVTGGIVFYGALIGGVLGALLGGIIARDDIRNYVDVIVPVLPVGHALGRIGCFCAGCCYGRPTEGPLGVVYTAAAGGAPAGIPLLPVQLFEAAADIIIAVILLTVSAKTRSKYLTAIMYCMMYSVVRFILEYYRYDSIRGIAGGLSTSQWISIVLFAAAGLSAVILGILSRKKGGKTA
ncbi:MAG: prolipoprotein diacylglyceryl transferase [Parasporobacterium sp.]|nr:prolipoprotein diacylglyceryl transferase [Parasporobacterium sp.]